ncbi:MAG: YncE family protein [Myxococcota bacterium]
MGSTSSARGRAIGKAGILTVALWLAGCARTGAGALPEVPSGAGEMPGPPQSVVTTEPEDEPEPTPVAPAPVEEPEPEPEPEALVMRPGGPELNVLRRVATGVQPKSVTVSPDGSRIYVCNFGLKHRRNVSVYDASTLELVGYINFRGNAVELAASRDGTTLYVSNFGRSVVEVVDAETFEVRDEIRVDSNPKFMVIDEARGMLYVSNWSSRSVSAVDLQRGKAVRRLHTGRRPRGLALLDDGTLLVGAMWDHRIQVYAPGSTRPDREFEACENPRHLMLSPDQQRLYVSCSGDRVLRWFDPLTGEVLGEAPTGLNPRTIDVSRDGRHIAIADFTSSTITVVDVEQMQHRTHEVPRTNQIVGLAVAPGESLKVYATSWLTNTLLELTPPAEAAAP